MIKRQTMVAAGAFLVGGIALASDSQFETHLQSVQHYSPAQTYHTQGMKSDFQLGFLNQDGTTTTSASDTKSETELSGTQIFAGGIFQINSNFRAGLTVDHLQSDNKFSTTTAGTSGSFDSDYTATTFTPFASFETGNIVAGAGIEVYNETNKSEDGPEIAGTYNTFNPGVVYKDTAFEAGLTYRSPNNLTAEAKKDGATYTTTLTSPATTTVHGAYALDNQMYVGGAISNKAYKALDEDQNADQTMVEVNGSIVPMPNLKVGGQVAYNGAYYKESETMNLGNISTMGIAAEVDYALEKAMSVGGGFRYATGSDENDTTKYEVNTLAVAVRGNYMF